MRKAIIFILLFLPLIVLSQQLTPIDKNASKIVGNDTNISVPFFGAALGWTFPMGDMGKEYESFFNVNANLGWKTKSNWLYIAEFGFQFGSNNIKHLEQILSTMYTDSRNSFVVGIDGTDAGVVAYNQNLSICLKFGKVIPIFGSNPNSGLVVLASGGYIQHQIIYDATQAHVPQLEGDYRYGYDRQKRGPLFGLTLGYMHISKRNYASFYIAMQYDLALTKLTRDCQFDMYDPIHQNFMPMDKTYKDQMFTIKLCWLIPLIGRSADKIYYY